MNLVLITPPSVSADRELSLILRLLDLSPNFALHVRKPNASTPQQLEDYIKQIPAQYHRRIVVHTHHQLARTLKLRGIHYRDSQIPDGTISALPGLTTSCSFHQLSQLGVCRGDVDYCFLSPIYDSISKEDYKQASFMEDTDALRDYIVTSRYPVLALGGVTPDNFDELADLGFSGAALLGCVWNCDDPVAALKEALRISDNIEWNNSGSSLSCSTS